MIDAISNTKQIIQLSANLLLSEQRNDDDNINSIYYYVDGVRLSHNALEEQFTITIGPELSTKKIVMFNSLTFTRSEVVTFIVSTPFIEVRNFYRNIFKNIYFTSSQVLDLNDNRVKCQVSPVFEYSSSMSNSKYQVSFIASVPALSLVSYTLHALTEKEVPP